MTRTGSHLNWMKRTVALLMIVCLTATLLSCGTSDSTESETAPTEQSTEQSTEAVTTIPPAEPGNTEPDPVADAALLFPDRFPIAFMINNVAAARPQSGLSKAKLIYQLMTEGRTTRLLLLTDSEDGVVGPVRSARPAYLDLVAQHRAFYCYAGNWRVIEDSPHVNEIRILDALKGDYSIFYRTDHRVAPHNLYIKLENAYARAEKKFGSISPDEPVQGLRVRDQFAKPGIGERVTEIHYHYSQLKESFKYDAEKQVYHKYNNDVLLVDEQTGQALEVANIIVLYRPHSLMPNGVHNKINWVDEAEATYLTAARKYTIDWEKTSRTDPIVYYLDGRELILNPGLTWVIVVDDSALKSVEYR